MHAGAKNASDANRCSQICLDDASDMSDPESWSEDTMSVGMSTSIRSSRIMSSSLMNTPQSQGITKEKAKRRQSPADSSDAGPGEPRSLVPTRSARSRKELLKAAAAVVQAHMHEELQAGELNLLRPLGGDDAAIHAPHACVFAGRWRGMPAAIRYVTFTPARSANNMSTADPEEALATALTAEVSVAYNLSHPNIVPLLRHNIQVAEVPTVPGISPSGAQLHHKIRSYNEAPVEAPRKCVQLLLVQVRRSRVRRCSCSAFNYAVCCTSLNPVAHAFSDGAVLLCPPSQDNKM
jgi:hypothetical protein